MSGSKNYRDLIVWQKSMDLVVLVYEITDLLPVEEKYGLTSQMRRCAVSVPSNIAEGQRRRSGKDFARFITIAYGSGAELETQLEISHRLNFIDQIQFEKVFLLLQEVMKMLNSLERSLKNSTNY